MGMTLKKCCWNALSKEGCVDHSKWGFTGSAYMNSAQINIYNLALFQNLAYTHLTSHYPFGYGRFLIA